MRKLQIVVSVAALSAAASLLWAADNAPGWAYGFPPSDGKAKAPPAAAPAPAAAKPPAAPDTKQLNVPGSTLSFTRTQVFDSFGPADWFPNEHPAMPDVVAHGRRPNIRACALCHYPNGRGRPENAEVSGLPVSYFIQTMLDFRNGDRKSSEPRKANTIAMMTFAKEMTDAEIKEAAEYFGAIKLTAPWIKVIESATAPKTTINIGLHIPVEGNEKEPLGKRIIEVPSNNEAAETLRDPHSGFIAYVPMGSVKKGEALVKSRQCAMCHGTGLKGLGPLPGIAGRSPSYVMRQMLDMQQGPRKGPWVALMKPVLEGLTEEDLLNISAYNANLSR